MLPASPDQEGPCRVSLWLPWREMMKHTALKTCLILPFLIFLVSSVSATVYDITPYRYVSWTFGESSGTSWANICDNHPNIQVKSGVVIEISTVTSNVTPWKEFAVGGYMFDTSSIPDDAYIESVSLMLQSSVLVKQFPNTEIIITDFTPSDPPSWINSDSWEIPQLENAYGSVSQDDLFVGGTFTNVPLYGFTVNKTGYTFTGLETNWYYEDLATNPMNSLQSYYQFSLAKLHIVTNGTVTPTPTPTPSPTPTTTPNWTPNVTAYPTPSYIPTTPGTFPTIAPINITPGWLLNFTNTSLFPSIVVANILSIWDMILNPIVSALNLLFNLITWPLQIITNAIQDFEAIATFAFLNVISYLQFWSLLFVTFFNSIPMAINYLIILSLVLTGVGLFLK